MFDVQLFTDVATCSPLEPPAGQPLPHRLKEPTFLTPFATSKFNLLLKIAFRSSRFSDELEQ
jgi:hypothetical protein